MSIRGDVPVPCFNCKDCERVGNGRNVCDTDKKICVNPNAEEFDLNQDPLGKCIRKFRYPIQGTWGTRARLNGIMNTARNMVSETVNWNQDNDKGFVEKINDIYLGNTERIIITSVIVLIIAIFILI